MPQNQYSGNVIEDYYIGKTHITICDDAYRNKTEADIQKILDEVNLICWRIMREKKIV